MRPAPQRQPRRAAAAVEFAVVSLVFFTLVLALIELGRGLMVDYLLVNAARQSCRVGTPAGRTTADITTAANDVLARSRLPQATIVVKVNGVVADAASAKTGDRISVAITMPASSISWVPGTRYLPVNLGGSYTLRRE